MSFNLSEEVVEDIVKTNVVLYSVAIAVVILPALAVFTTIIIALLLTKRIHWKIRMLMVYIILPEVVSVVHQIQTSIYPIVYFRGLETPGICPVAAYIYFFAYDFRLVSLFLYSLCIYLGLRVGLSKINVFLYVTMLAAPPVFLLLLNIMMLFDKSFVETNIGSCGSTSISPIYAVRHIITLILDWIILTTLTVTFSILSLCYVKKNTIENKDIQKGMMKSFVYFLIVGAIHVVSPFFLALYFYILNNTTISVASIQVARAVLIALNNIVPILPSVAMIYFVKPLWETLKSCCVFYRKKNVTESA